MIGSRTDTRGLYGRYDLGTYANPSYDVSTQFIPRNFHDLLKQTRFILIKSPTVTEVLRKMATYPMTEVSYTTNNESLRKKYNEITDSVRVIEKLSDAGFDYSAHGNAFLSIYYPFERMLECRECENLINARTSLGKEVKWTKFGFHGTCPSCHTTGVFKVKDTRSRDISRINIIKWKLDHIAVNENPISGESEYYYTIPGDVKRKVILGDPHFICTMPMGFIDAIRLNKDFMFAKDEVYHLKGLSMGDLIPGFGVPPLLSMYSTVFYMQCLRKANESIALEHMNPMRMIYPQQGSANADPIASMSMGNFTAAMKTNLQKFKQDPNHILLSPIPIGVGYMGGQGKSLLVTNELQFAEEQLLMGQGVSRELLSGTTNWTSSTVGLRLLENNMNQYVRKLRNTLDWIYSKIANFLDIEKLDVDLVPFELTDNDNLKQMYLSMLDNNLIDETTVLEIFGMDPDKIKSRLREQAVHKAEEAVRTAEAVKRATFQANQSDDDGEDDNGYKEHRAEVVKLAQKLSQATPEEQQKMAIQLKHDNPAMFAEVVSLIQGDGNGDE